MGEYHRKQFFYRMMTLNTSSSKWPDISEERALLSVLEVESHSISGAVILDLRSRLRLVTSCAGRETE